MSRMVATGCWYVQVAAPTVATADGRWGLQRWLMDRAHALASSQLSVRIFFPLSVCLSLFAPTDRKREEGLCRPAFLLFPAVSARLACVRLASPRGPWRSVITHFLN